MYVDYTLLPFDIQPILHDDGIMLPLRVLCEYTGFLVNWENDLKRATIHGHGRDVALYPENPLYAVNGILNRTEQPPWIREGRLMVSLSFLEKGVGLVLADGSPEKGFLHFKTEQVPINAGKNDLPAGAPGDIEQPVYFVELLLPSDDRVKVGEVFEIRLAAPFVRGIYAYEVSFFYDPEIIRVQDVQNPAYRLSDEFYIKKISNREGSMRYTLTTLGTADRIEPRETLAVIEAVVSREGAVPLIAGTLQVTLLDNKARVMPVGLEERVLYVDPDEESS